MNVCFNGYGENVVTFETEGTVTAGDPVMISGSGKVSAASGEFCGICRSVRNGYAAVQLAGYARVPYTTAPDAGYAMLTASSGKISAGSGTGAREFLVVDVDTTAQIAGIIL